MTAARHAVRSVCAFLALLLVQCSEFVWGALYHHAHPAWVLGAVIGAYALVFAGGAWLACRLISAQRVGVLLDFLSLQMGALFALGILRRLQLVEGALGMPVRLALAAGSAGLAVWLLRRADGALRARIGNAMIVASALFVLSPPLMAAFMAAPGLLPVSATTNPAAPPVLVLLLDELGDRSAAPVAAALVGAGLQVRHTALAPLGENTVNVIPAMLTGKDFSAAQPCSTTAICNAGQILDFARLRSAEPRMNIVGFHHPYCAIEGLRYCYQALTPSIANPAIWFGCVLLKATTRRSPGACENRLLSVDQVEAARGELLAAAGRAPFWREGGVLFVHVPLPHPPGRRDGPTLDQDYAANLADAGTLVASLALRMRQSFGAQHAIVVSSDHPLRPRVWCAMARYKVAGCALRAEFIDDRIPLLVATPGPIPAQVSASDLFSTVNALRALGAR